MELGFADRTHSLSVDKADGSHSLPDCWSAQRRRLNSLACSSVQMPSLSTALITSSTSESSEDVEDEEEEKAWPLRAVAEEWSSALADSEHRRRRPFRRPRRPSLLTSLLRRPSAPVWEYLPLTSRLQSPEEDQQPYEDLSDNERESHWRALIRRETKSRHDEREGEDG